MGGSISPGLLQIVTREAHFPQSCKVVDQPQGQRGPEPTIQLIQISPKQKRPAGTSRPSLKRPHYPVRFCDPEGLTLSRKLGALILAPSSSLLGWGKRSAPTPVDCGLSQMRGLTCILQTPSITLPQSLFVNIGEVD